MNNLIQRFLASICEVSYFEAAEGPQYLKETAARHAAKGVYVSLRREMVLQFGKQTTINTIVSIPNSMLDEAIDYS